MSFMTPPVPHLRGMQRPAPPGGDLAQFDRILKNDLDIRNVIIAAQQSNNLKLYEARRSPSSSSTTSSASNSSINKVYETRDRLRVGRVVWKPLQSLFRRSNQPLYPPEWRRFNHCMGETGAIALLGETTRILGGRRNDAAVRTESFTVTPGSATAAVDTRQWVNERSDSHLVAEINRRSPVIDEHNALSTSPLEEVA